MDARVECGKERQKGTALVCALEYALGGLAGKCLARSWECEGKGVASLPRDE